MSFDFVDETNLSEYATSAGWAAALGARAKRNPDLFVEKLRGRLSSDTIERSSQAAIGRVAMLEILRSLPREGETGAIQSMYADHLEGCLDTADCAA